MQRADVGMMVGDCVHTFIRVNILIMVSLFSLCAGSENWTVGDLLTLLQAFLELDAVNGTCALVFCPATAGDVAPHDSFDRENVGTLNEHGTTFDLLLDRFELLFELHGELGVVCGDDVRLDEGWCQEAEPESGECMEKLALVWDALSFSSQGWGTNPKISTGSMHLACDEGGATHVLKNDIEG